MYKWEILWNHRNMILVGFQNTLLLFSVSAVAAFLLSVAIVLAIQTRSGAISSSMRAIVDGMRTLPF
jgi:polar amino acid transport system permease protein